MWKRCGFQRRVEHQAVQNHLTANFWGKGILQHFCQAPDTLPLKELLHWYLGPERRDPKGTGVSGAHNQLIREVLWLDHANAYGSINWSKRHWTWHHIPGKFRDLILDYYNSFSLRFSAGSTTSEWRKLEKGNITVCTIAGILFALAMNMLVKSAEIQCRGPFTKSGVWQPPIRAFMDDLTVMTTSVPGSRWILNGLEEMITEAWRRWSPRLAWGSSRRSPDPWYRPWCRSLVQTHDKHRPIYIIVFWNSFIICTVHANKSAFLQEILKMHCTALCADSDKHRSVLRPKAWM